MKNLELQSLNFVEMTNEEMNVLDGGSWIGDALRWTKDHIEEIVTVVVCVVTIVGAVKSNT